MAEHLAEKQNTFIKLFVPCKGDSVWAVIRKVFVILCFTVAIVCLVLVLTEKKEQYDDKKMNEDINKTLVLNASGTFSASEEKIEEIKKEVPEIMDKFLDLYAQNSDLVGWLKVGHYIDYPVLMHVENEDFYLDHNFKKEYQKSGSLFVSSRVLPLSDVNNLVIYGHNMNTGEYLHNILWYNPHNPVANGQFIDYYKKYPTLQYDTLYEEGTYKIFAGIYINTEDKDGYPYPYYRKRQFKSEYEFMDFVGNIMDRSLFYTDVDLQYGDEIVTLSTCSWYPVGKDVDTRFALFARKVRPGESPEVDVDKITVNPSPLYFDAYYKRMGGSWEGRKWDLSLVKNFDKYTDRIDSQDGVEPEVVTVAPTQTTAPEQTTASN